LTLSEAIAIAKHVKKAREIAGMHTDVPYSQIQLVDALATILTVCGDNPVSHEDHVHVTRQLTAANARLAKYEKPGRG
jgi:hypothetical protein